jgi:hypothetical protein
MIDGVRREKVTRRQSGMSGADDDGGDVFDDALRGG